MTTYKVVPGMDDGFFRVEGLPHQFMPSLGDHSEFKGPTDDFKDLVTNIATKNKKVAPGDIFDTPGGMFEFVPPTALPYTPPAPPAPDPAQACGGGCGGSCGPGGCGGNCTCPTQPAGANPVQKINATVQFQAFDGKQVLAGHFSILMPASSQELATEFDKVSNAVEPSDITNSIITPGWPNAGPRIIELTYPTNGHRVVVVLS